MVTGVSLTGYATYVPAHRLDRGELATALGAGSGRGQRVVASFDEDSTTMGVAAAAPVLRSASAAPAALYFATTSPVYADKTNACAVHAALALPGETFAADLAGSARSAIAGWRAAAATGGLLVLSDVRMGRPGSADERDGADGAAAFLFGDPADAIAEVIGEYSLSAEVLDRWRAPGDPRGSQWEERFGLEAYLPLAKRVAGEALSAAGLATADHLVVVSPNSAVRKKAGSIAAAIPLAEVPLGHAGAVDFGFGLAHALDIARPGETILLLSVADGCDAVVLRTTPRLARGRQAVPLLAQCAGGVPVSYPTYLTWRGWLEREPPRRPEPDRPAGPPSARAAAWKFAFSGSVCRRCAFVHLPPARVCKRCSAVDDMDRKPLNASTGTVATYTVDRLAFSPSPPLVEAVIDFDGGGRYTLEVADAQPDQLAVGTAVGLTFRKLYEADGVHNYFWKARILEPGERAWEPPASLQGVTP
ncbi:OB-fold domain-containing protein [Nocardia jinanensis]|uniref:ChsH2 C-terminal OB-fold domain-containing protein n=1 Tax=Nocardia jinanensis TaxID=382504 RepID=A0A917VSJ7_9NOCA|nr:OB-fold domain-containing protein [Nocardia jinanensis]GGL10052.1 hypothetical protein GCM10011588_25580 [Nocardia jinanensis]